ncbi:MAG: DUF692 domain-containing protein [Betaproteobacteria bacterium]
MQRAPFVLPSPSLSGIGLRAAHYRDFLDGRPPVDWVEVHSENYFGDGGYDLHVLEHVRANYPVSLHGVGLSLGSADGLRERHLAKLVRLVDRFEPMLVSEHLCWGALGERHFNDLLPMPFTEQALAVMVRHVTQVQEALRREILVENVSSYVTYRESAMGEMAFLVELARRSGCGLLLDVNNLHVNAVNHGADARAEMACVPAGVVGEIHLAGYAEVDDLLVDDHGSRVSPPVWDLYAAACRQLGPVPTLIEWDTNVPALAVLLAEAAAASAVRDATHV